MSIENDFHSMQDKEISFLCFTLVSRRDMDRWHFRRNKPVDFDKDGTCFFENWLIEDQKKNMNLFFLENRKIFFLLFIRFVRTVTFRSETSWTWSSTVT